MQNKSQISYSERGLKWLSHFGPKDRSVRQRTALHITRTDEMPMQLGTQTMTKD